jgi:hypothetical protein
VAGFFGARPDTSTAMLEQITGYSEQELESIAPISDPDAITTCNVSRMAQMGTYLVSRGGGGRKYQSFYALPFSSRVVDATLAHAFLSAIAAGGGGVGQRMRQAGARPRATVSVHLDSAAPSCCAATCCCVAVRVHTHARWLCCPRPSKPAHQPKGGAMLSCCLLFQHACPFLRPPVIALTGLYKGDPLRSAASDGTWRLATETGDAAIWVHIHQTAQTAQCINRMYRASPCGSADGAGSLVLMPTTVHAYSCFGGVDTQNMQLLSSFNSIVKQTLNASFLGIRQQVCVRMPCTAGLPVALRSHSRLEVGTPACCCRFGEVRASRCNRPCLATA